MTTIEVHTVSVEEEIVEASKLWWLLTVLGVISIVAGGILVARPSKSLNVLAVVFGIFLLIDGIIALIWVIRSRGPSRGLEAVVAVVSLIFGLLLVRHPSGAVNFVGLLIGIALVAGGALRMVRAIELGPSFWRIVIALLELVIGVVIVAEPHIGYKTLAIITGVWLILNGIATIALSVLLRRAGKEAASPEAAAAAS